MADTSYEEQLKKKIKRQNRAKEDKELQTLIDDSTSANHRSTLLRVNGGASTSIYPPALLRKRALFRREYDRKMNNPLRKEYLKRQDKRNKIKEEEESA